MEGHVNTYGGMDKDSAYDSIKQNMYIDALDIRISTDKGESNGAFTNIKGNEISFTIPTSGTFNGKSWVINPAGGIPEVIGYGTIRNKIILFVADDEGQKGWIYQVEYDPATREVIGGVATLLYYNANLFFKKEWPIEALGRYENATVQRIYWTDYNNIFRTINVADPDLNTFSVDNIDIFPSVEFTQPIVNSISGAGNLNSGMYQIAYRLITSDGKETLISPPSNMIHIVRASEYNSVAEYVGEPEKINAQKTINLFVDTSSYLGVFEKIEFFSLYYESPIATPVASSIEILDIISDTTELTYTGGEESIFDIELFTFTSKNFAFKTFKSVTQKDNYLVGANIKGSTISIQDLLEPGEFFTGLTKRYNNSSNPPSGTDLEQAFNAEFNKDRHWDLDWQLDTNQYKYKADGTTLGGEGLDISYSFHLEPMTLDVEQQPSFHNIGSNVQYGIDQHDLNDGYGVYPNPDGSSVNAASPIVSSLLRGYKRGETYRFGIIFYTLKGEATYVEYIGDIKFPDISEADGVDNNSNSPYWPLSTVYNDTTGTIGRPGKPITAGLNLGIRFRVSFNRCTSILNKIEGFQIVRVDRTNLDKRRISQGIINPYSHTNMGDTPSNPDYDFRVNEDSRVLHHFNTPEVWKYKQGNGAIIEDAVRQTTPDPQNDSLKYYIDEQDNDIGGIPYTNYNSIFPQIPGREDAIVNTTIKSQYLSFYSPEMSYNFDGIPDIALNAANNAAILMTGCYTAVNSPSPPNADDYRIDFTQTGLGPPAQNLGGNTDLDIYDVGFKFRRVGPITFNSIENIRKIKRSTYFDMRDSSNVSIDTKYVLFPQDKQREQVLNPTIPQMPRRDVNQAGYSQAPSPDLARGDTYIRNYFAYIGTIASTLPSNYALWGLNNPRVGSTNNRSGAVGRAGTNLTVLIDTFDIDPTDSSITYTTPGTDKPWRDYFLIANNTTHTTINADNPHITPLPVPDGFGGTTTINRHQAIPIADLVIPKKEIYGGFSTNALESNSFIPASPVIKTGSAPIFNYDQIVYGGDIFISMFSLQKAMVEFFEELFDSNADYDNTFSRTDLMPVESVINLNLNNSANTTRGIKFFYENLVAGGQELRIYRQEDNNSFSDYGIKDPGLDYFKTYSYNPIFSQIPNQVLFFVQPSSLTDLSLTNDVRAYLSSVKVNGEDIDSWTKFAINDFYDVDDHGPINKIVNFKDNVYFIQDQATGVYSINREAITTTDDGVPTELGTAKGWGKHQYYSKENGSIHQWAVAVTDRGIYFFDAIHRKIFQLGQGKTGLTNSPLSELKGMHSYLQDLGEDVFIRKEDGGDNPVKFKGAHIGVDEINDEVIFTFLSVTARGTVESIVFDELANQFSTRLSITPKMWINNGDTLITPNYNIGNENDIYVHNIGNWGEFYGNQKECELTLVINPKADINKVLRFLEFNSIVRNDDKDITRTETITAFRIQTEVQDSGKINYSSGRIKRRFDKWRIKLPRDKDSRGRFRSTHFLLTLYFDNTYNKELIMNRLISYYNPQIF